MPSSEIPDIPPAYEHVVRGIRQAEVRGLLTKEQVDEMIDRLRAKGAPSSAGADTTAG
jgi:hypothetical protein